MPTQALDVLTMGIWSGVPSWDETPFVGGLSLHDYDVVIWDPNAAATMFGVDSRDRSPVLAYESSRLFAEAIEQRAKEFDVLIKAGGIAVVFGEVPIWFELNLPYGVEYRRSAWELIPDLPIATEARGSKIDIVGHSSITTFLEANRGLITFQASYASGNHWVPLAVVPRTREAVALVRRHESGGTYLVLPRMELDDDEAFSTRVLMPLVDALRSGLAAEEAPSWASNYRTNREDSILSEIAVQRETLVRASEQMHELEVDAASEKRPKVLLYGAGKELEEACLRAFEELGATRVATGANRADLVMDFGGWLAVVEIKGLGKSAAEKNAAQLEKWASEFVGTDKVVKPILLVNAFRGTDPEVRTERAFPQQMLPYSESRGHLLMTTSQLFEIQMTAQESPQKVPGILKELRTKIGVLAGHDVDRFAGLQYSEHGGSAHDAASTR